MRRQLHRIGPGRDLEGVEEAERDGHGRLGAGQVLEVRQRNEGALFPGRASRAVDVTVWVAGPGTCSVPHGTGYPGIRLFTPASVRCPRCQSITSWLK